MRPAKRIRLCRFYKLWRTHALSGVHHKLRPRNPPSRLSAFSILPPFLLPPKMSEFPFGHHHHRRHERRPDDEEEEQRYPAPENRPPPPEYERPYSQPPEYHRPRPPSDYDRPITEPPVHGSGGGGYGFPDSGYGAPHFPPESVDYLPAPTYGSVLHASHEARPEAEEHHHRVRPDSGYGAPHFPQESANYPPGPTYGSVLPSSHEVRPEAEEHHHRNPFSHVHHHRHEGGGLPEEVSRKPTVRVFCQAGERYSLAIRDGKIILAQSDPSDPYQVGTFWLVFTLFVPSFLSIGGFSLGKKLKTPKSSLDLLLILYLAASRNPHPPLNPLASTRFPIPALSLSN
ncbi:hypothetical protein ACLOJK_025075 [Asimina triloba]